MRGGGKEGGERETDTVIIDKTLIHHDILNIKSIFQ